MIDRHPACTACFPRHSQPRCRTFGSSDSALAEYGRLHHGGQSPFMCQQNDGRYRVCVLPASAVAADPRLVARAA